MGPDGIEEVGWWGGEQAQVLLPMKVRLPHRAQSRKKAYNFGHHIRGRRVESRPKRIADFGHALVLEQQGRRNRRVSLRQADGDFHDFERVTLERVQVINFAYVLRRAFERLGKDANYVFIKPGCVDSADVDLLWHLTHDPRHGRDACKLVCGPLDLRLSTPRAADHTG